VETFAHQIRNLLNEAKSKTDSSAESLGFTQNRDVLAPREINSQQAFLSQTLQNHETLQSHRRDVAEPRDRRGQ
jgi:hypothetical protein